MVNTFWLLFVAMTVGAAGLPGFALSSDDTALEIVVLDALIDGTFDKRVLITGEISAGGAPVRGTEVTVHHKDADGPLLGEATTDAAGQFEILAIGREDWPRHTHPGALLSDILHVEPLDPVLIKGVKLGFQPVEHTVELRPGIVPFREGSRGDSRSCTDGLDNDGDGSVDSEDDDCAPSPGFSTDWGDVMEGFNQALLIGGIITLAMLGGIAVLVAGGWYLVRRTRRPRR